MCGDDLKEMSKISSKNFNLLNVNIRSLYKKFESLKDFLQESNMNFNIIGLVETWLKDRPHEYFEMEGYNLELTNRQNKGGGGVCLYIDENIAYSLRNDLHQIKHPEYTESLFIEIERNKSKNIVVGIVYRPPDQDMNEFNKFTDSLLSKITKNENKLVYIMGDFNINLLNEDIHVQTADFINTISSYSMCPSITRPTGITTKSATLIDNIFTNSHTKQTSGIILYDLSDHLPIFISTNFKIHKDIQENDDTEIRDMNDNNIQLFKQKLGEVNWSSVCSSDDANMSYVKFMEKFQELYDECIPKKRIKKRKSRNNPRTPWISQSLLKCIRRRNILYKKSILKPTEENILKYKMYRNKLNTTIKLAKQNYYSNQLEHERGNMRNTWKILNSFLRCSKKSPSRKFSHGGIDITDPKQIANGFNQYFANVGPALASSISHSGNDFNHHLQNSNSFICFFKPTNEEETHKGNKKLGSRKSPGHDGIKSDLVKQIAEEIALASFENYL